VPEGKLELSLELDRLETLFEGGDARRAYESARELAERALAAGDRVAELVASIERTKFATYVEPEGATERLERLASEALTEFETAGDDLVLYVAHAARASAAHMHAQMDEEREAVDQAAAYARRLGFPHYEERLLPYAATSRLNGTTPVLEVIAWCEQRLAAGDTHPDLEIHRAQALALLGRFDESRTRARTLREELEERGAHVWLAITLWMQARVEHIAGDPAAAVEFGSRSAALLEEMGERSWRSTVIAGEADDLYELGDLEAAWTLAERAEELGASDDIATVLIVLEVRAKVLARRGDFAEAERLAREAVELSRTVAIVEAKGQAYEDLAEVLALAGKTAEAVQALEEALAIYEAKGAVALIERVRRRLSELA
jgi:tetratricopeptide (TPR) repeat protein